MDKINLQNIKNQLETEFINLITNMIKFMKSSKKSKAYYHSTKINKLFFEGPYDKIRFILNNTGYKLFYKFHGSYYIFKLKYNIKY